MVKCLMVIISVVPLCYARDLMIKAGKSSVAGGGEGVKKHKHSSIPTINPKP